LLQEQLGLFGAHLVQLCRQLPAEQGGRHQAPGQLPVITYDLPAAATAAAGLVLSRFLPAIACNRKAALLVVAVLDICPVFCAPRLMQVPSQQPAEWHPAGGVVGTGWHETHVGAVLLMRWCHIAVGAACLGCAAGFWCSCGVNLRSDKGTHRRPGTPHAFAVAEFGPALACTSLQHRASCTHCSCCRQCT
jgi:hypothetical protein